MTTAQKNKRAYNLWAPDYDLQRPPHCFLEEASFVELADVGPQDILLDAACGTGRYSKIFSDRGAQVFGCDLSEAMLEVARVKVPDANFALVDLNDRLPYEDHFFSKVVCSLSLRHVENLQTCLSEILRVLRPGGLFVFSTIHPNMDWQSYARLNPPLVDVNLEAVTFPYSQQDLEHAVEEAGFVIKMVKEVPADLTVKPFLTEASFAKLVGKNFVLLFSALSQLR